MVSFGHNGRGWATGARALLLLLSIMTLVWLSCGGDDGGTNPGDPPQITQFTATPGDIMPGDSSRVDYRATGADSTVLTPGQRLADPDSGSFYVKPALPTEYTLVAYNAHGRDSAELAITMTGAVARITSLTVSTPTILEGDSITLSWASQLADSLVINHGVGKVGDPSSGSVVLYPDESKLYMAVAYNPIGWDTATVTVVMQVPTLVEAVNGLYYRGEMGSSTMAPELQFRLVDAVGSPINRIPIFFSLLSGDGDLGSTSVMPNTAGIAMNEYTFSGTRGDAIIGARVPGVDSIEVIVRANTLIPGSGGQGQYILLDDDFYSMVKNFNGEPAAIGIDPVYTILYADYEAARGVVVMIEDVNQDEVPQLTEPVHGVIVNTTYSKTTAGGIGIGSHIDDVIAAYGVPDDVGVDPTPPAADYYVFYDPNMTYYANPADSIVFEIHLHYTPSGVSSALKPRSVQTATGETSPRGYRFVP